MAYTNDPQILSNWTRTFDTSNLGTRKLAFYQVYVEGDFGLLETWQDNDSLYYKIVRAIQEAAGGELYYLGEPGHNYGTPGTDFFIFGIADDAEPDYAYLENTDTYEVIETDVNGWVRVNENSLYIGLGIPVTFNGSVFGGLVQGKTYYARDFDSGPSNTTWIQLSDYVETHSNDGTGDYPANSIGTPGATTMDTVADTGSIDITVYAYDIHWTGRAGDIQWACCSDAIFKTIFASRFEDALYGVPELQGPGNWDVVRCQVTNGVYPFNCC
jgi:hypothetical protein